MKHCPRAVSIARPSTLQLTALPSELAAAKCMKVYNQYVKIDASRLEIATEGQSTCMAWRDSRKIRITASTANKVPKRDTTNSDKFIKEQLYPSFRGNAATKYGQEQEVKAREFFEEHIMTKVNTKGTVLWVGNEWLSASPDGIINNSEVLEIKCPYVNDLSLIIDSGEYDVKKNSDGALYLATTGPRGYYMQVQLTMACCDLQACKLLLWRNKEDNVIIDVSFDTEYVEKLVEKLRVFYFSKFLPRLSDDIEASRFVFCDEYMALCSA